MLHNLIITLIINRHGHDTRYGKDIEAIMDGASAKGKNDLICSLSKEKTIDYV